MASMEVVGPLLIHQVPFCPPFWSELSNFTGPSKAVKSLWSQLPKECRTANVTAAVITCLVSVVCILIHAATIVAYSNLRGDILHRKQKAAERRIQRRRKADLSIIKEAADFAFAMTTQERLRMTFAFIGVLSSGLLLPIVVASAGVAYSQPFPDYVLNPQKSWEDLRSYSLAIAALFHLTLTASLCTLLLMVIERFRETMRICPDNFIKSAKAEPGKSYPRDSHDFADDSLSTPGRRRNGWKSDPDVIPRREQHKLGKMEDTFIYAFQQSYTFLDLVMALVVPLTSGIVTTIALAVFGAQFEPFGLIVSSAYRTGRMPSINGLISYTVGSYPDSIYVYSATVGVLFLACVFLNFVSMLRCHTLMSIAKYLPGYQHSRDLFKFGEGKKSGRKRKQKSVPRIVAPDSVRLSRRYPWNNRQSRQDPDGLSIDDLDYYESSISSFPLPPPPQQSSNRFSVMSVDTISLPPPPRPDSIMEVPNQISMFAFPSLPSVVRHDDVDYDELPDNEVTAIKAEAFFGNIRQSKVVMATFVLFIFLAAPLVIVFAAGVFYPHDGTLLSIMGNVNSSTFIATKSQEILNAVNAGSGYVEPTPPDPFLESTTGIGNEETLNDLKLAANQKNWVTTLSGVFLILYAVASIVPFFAYCAASRRFRLEASRFFCFCLFFQWYRYGKRIKKEQQQEEVARSRSNRSVISASSNGYRNRSLHSINDIRGATNPSSLPRDVRYSMKHTSRGYDRERPPLRREKTIAGARNVSWELPDQYGSARM